MGSGPGLCRTSQNSVKRKFTGIAHLPHRLGLHNKWKKRPLALSRTRGRPVLAQNAAEPNPSFSRPGLWRDLAPYPSSWRPWEASRA